MTYISLDVSRENTRRVRCKTAEKNEQVECKYEVLQKPKFSEIPKAVSLYLRSFDAIAVRIVLRTIS